MWHRWVLFACVIGVIVWQLHFLWLRRQLRFIAATILPLLEEVGQPHWIDFGTLLGVMREGDIIHGDWDVDVCLLDDDPVKTDCRLKAFADRLEQENPHLFLVRRMWTRGSRVCHRFCPYLFADLYHNEPAANGDMYSGATGGNSDVPRAIIGQPQLHYWAATGIMVRVPEHPEDVLRWRYGDDWRTPHPGYKGRDSPE